MDILPSLHAPTGAAAVPDSQGLNLYRADPWLAPLLGLYLPADLLAHLAPHLDRMGALAGAGWMRWPGSPTGTGRCWCIATGAARMPRPSTTTRPTGSWSGWPSPIGLAAMSHRGGVLGWPRPMPPAAKYALSYLFVQAEFGLCCPLSMTDALARTLRRFGDPELVARYLPGLIETDLDALRQGAMFMTEQGRAPTSRPPRCWPSRARMAAGR
ncbi:hypothetical protein ACFQY5_16205 [Paeniroseomonas aquatica]|uniref:hypothetical protein n=1 Tax=Paeniroseomonas aquatica TaxID=373043 RepID=UPI00360B7CD4